MFPKQQKNYYVDNEEFRLALKRFRESGLKLSEHPDGNYIGETIIKICRNLSLSKNFIGYTYRDEFIEDAIENCVRYVKNFDPDKSKYAFTYFSKIAYSAFVRRIKKEKDQQKVKYKMLSDSTVLSDIMEQYNDATNSDADVNQLVEQISKMMKDSDKLVDASKPSRKKKKMEETVEEAVNSLGRFFGEAE